MSQCQLPLTKRDIPNSLDLFVNKKQWIYFFIGCVCIFLFNLYFIYQDYRSYQSNTSYEMIAEVKSQYLKTKNKKQYFVLRVQDLKKYNFYTTSFLDLKLLINSKVRIYGKMAQCDFLKFLKGCYFNAYQIALMPKDAFKDRLREAINKEHSKLEHALFFRALFFGDSLTMESRKFINALGIAHLVAISGFHLGILSAFLLVILTPLYNFFHQRYFTYRNRFYDLGFLVLLCMFFYLILLDFQASFFRAFLMGVFGFWLFYNRIKILSFHMLLVLVVLMLAFFPRLIFNIGFILSVSGVFYIFLILKYLPKTKWYIWIFVFNISIFLLMGVVVHFYFPYFSPYQFLSIPLSIIFVAWFPLMLFLHCIGFGGIFDSFLEKILAFELPVIDFYTPLLLLVFYILLSLCAIFNKRCFYALLFCSIVFYGYLIYLFFIKKFF
ncbi:MULTISPECIES: ComEC/Rec2 family competence protein [unclassified Helicobacter]|uniref:ComEC/Rec2 family competence protein n=1 Tax=unclassified Helicobacter TaxID=2593540 RepID=UPI000CF02B2D|nr:MULTISPECIES: ComEC/Rec2 family competence protein [unclassified Helicobacter]